MDVKRRLPLHGYEYPLTSSLFTDQYERRMFDHEWKGILSFCPDHLVNTVHRNRPPHRSRYLRVGISPA